ncbi:MAG: hypothetical protein JO233_04080, partial [Candidatus Eremiobacteraeota bacterium]|nr:hypothetical protein [Candidatus Eremiobacteraeota bacterium]
PYIITPDTGAAHLAGMLGVACTDIFEPARFEIQSARWSPWCDRHALRAFPSNGATLQNFGQVLFEDWQRR